MEQSSLSELLVPRNSSRPSFRYYMTFVSSDGCKVHVPMIVSSIKNFESCPEQRMLKEMRRKMKVAFRNEAPEFSPFLKPDAEFFMKARVRTCHTEVEVRGRSSLRVRNSQTIASDSSQSQPDHSLGELPQIPGDLASLESFAQAFVSKRVELNLTQKEVARSLEKIYGVCRSATLISRIERMDLRLGNYLKLYPVLLRWLKDTESPDSRAAIIQAACDGDAEIMVDPPDESAVVASQFRKRRGRTVINNKARAVLTAAFRNNTHPSLLEFKDIAAASGLDLKVIRIWFRNKRNRMNEQSK